MTPTPTTAATGIESPFWTITSIHFQLRILPFLVSIKPRTFVACVAAVAWASAEASEEYESGDGDVLIGC